MHVLAQINLFPRISHVQSRSRREHEIPAMNRPCPEPQSLYTHDTLNRRRIAETIPTKNKIRLTTPSGEVTKKLSLLPALLVLEQGLF